MVPVQFFRKAVVPAPFTCTRADSKVPFRLPGTEATNSAVRFWERASFRNISSTRATTRVHSSGPRPALIWIMYASIGLFLIHPDDLRHKLTVHIYQRRLPLHYR